MSSARKKAKLDFGAMVASCQTVKSQAETIQQKCNAFVSTSKAVTDHLLVRIFSLCGQDAVEMMLVSIVGLDGLDSLRTAMQLVPETYLERRVPIVTKIVNKVLEQNGRDRLNEAQCSSFMSLLQLNCKQYSQRKVHPDAYDKELQCFLHEHKTGHNAFLGPPTKHCLNSTCDRHQLSTYSAPTNVTVFTANGPRPATKLVLKCSKCNTNYGYSKYGNKLITGERYYAESRQLVEASDVVFVDRSLHQLFASLRYVFSISL